MTSGSGFMLFHFLPHEEETVTYLGDAVSEVEVEAETMVYSEADSVA